MTSWIAAKSSCWPSPLILNFRYSLFFGRPASNHTSEPTVSRPWLCEMSTHTRLRGTALSPRSRPSA